MAFCLRLFFFLLLLATVLLNVMFVTRSMHNFPCRRSTAVGHHNTVGMLVTHFHVFCCCCNKCLDRLLPPVRRYAPVQMKIFTVSWNLFAHSHTQSGQLNFTVSTQCLCHNDLNTTTRPFPWLRDGSGHHFIWNRYSVYIFNEMCTRRVREDMSPFRNSSRTNGTCTK